MALGPCDRLPLGKLFSAVMTPDWWRRRAINGAGEWEAIQVRAKLMHRAGTPEEMANAALLLCSDAGSFITGADLQITGGGHL
ncbi:MAG: SDR family oxidoreductase [Casimicrobiaceae bacterium]